MTFDFKVPTPSGEMTFKVEPGTSTLFVGANGGGKTRLAVRIEDQLALRAHRIAAHRALSLNPEVAKISEKFALRGLRVGVASEQGQILHRIGSRWQQKAAVSLLNDYDYLVQALFAEQANTSLVTHMNARAGATTSPTPTKFERLVEIWGRVLPHRKLSISGDDIRAAQIHQSETYSASEMSDGERSVFYLVGQTLVAPDDSLIIFDEPELHIHRSIMSRLWDELEAARPDCGMVLITHDLDFAASREGQKYILREFDPGQGWTIEPVPEDTGFTEDMTTLILGSRRPVLFVEGNGGSLDQAIYRACYRDWTIIPRGSCEEVIHAVTTMRANASLTRITCAGIVDADAYDTSEIEFLKSKHIAVLPVSEIENVFLLPSVVEAIATAEGYSGATLIAKVTSIRDELLTHASNRTNQVPIILRYCRRRIDRTLKKVDFSDADNISALASEYSTNIAALDIEALAKMADVNMAKAIADSDIPSLLKWYDNKGIMAIACKAKNTTRQQFEQWIVRALLNDSAPAMSAAIRAILPVLKAA